FRYRRARRDGYDGDFVIATIHDNATSTQLCPRFAVDHPRGAKSIDEHAETLCPKGLLQWHPHRPTLCECSEDPLSLIGILDGDRHRESLRLTKELRGRIRTHQNRVAHRHSGVHDS